MRKAFTFIHTYKAICFLALLFSVNTSLDAQVSGVVFNDFNGSGAKDNTATFNESFVSGTTVNATLADGTTFTATTDANGAYSFTAAQIPAGTPVRIEFIDPVSSSFKGAANGTNVQFTTGGSSNVDYAVLSTDDYWDNVNNPVPSLLVVHHNRGTADNSAYGGYKVLLHTDNGASGPNNPTASDIVTIDTSKRPASNYQVGASFGLAYQLKQQRFFQAAFMKRLAGFGPKGTGGIYIMDKAGATWNYAASFSLNGVTPSNGGGVLNFGSVVRTTTPGTNAATANYISPINGQWSTPHGSDGRDNDAFYKVGRMSIGGIEVDRCEDTLFVVNIFQRKLITVDISGTTSSLDNASAATLGALTKAYDMVSLPGFPAALAAGDTIRPFGIKFYKGKGYLGVVNDAMGSQALANLKGYILEFNPHNIAAGFTNILTINFDQYADNFWQPWLSTWTQTGGTNSSGPSVYPQPMISDIEFNEDGSMDIGIRDRWGDQGGSFEYWPVATPSTTVDHNQTNAQGDLLHVCKVNGTWAIEGASGSCTQLLANNSNLNGSVGYTSSYGSNGKEYYGDHAGDDNPENGFGGLAKIMGSKKIVSTCLDPMIDGASAGSNYWSTSGIKWNDNVTGIQSQIARCIGGNFNNFDKANSLGDLEFVQECPKIQIGNRLWVDTDNDGIQDANEAPIDAATVELVAPGADGTFGTADDVVLATTTTDANGTYYFTALSAADSRKPNTWVGVGTIDILPSTDYQVRVPMSQTAITTNSYAATTANTNTNGSDNIDSDGEIISVGADQYSAIVFNTKTTNHNFDFGFKVGCALSASATSTNVACNGGSTGAADVTVTGAVGTPTYLWSNSATTEDLNAVVAGTYTITITEGACTATASVTITEPTALALTCAKVDVTTPSGTNGEANVTATDGTSPYTYLWSNGGTTASITGVAAGTYTVTVTDANGCTSTCSSTINEPGCNLAASETHTDVSCHGGNNGLIDVTVTGAVGTPTYLWSNAATSEDINGLTAGTYTVTITEGVCTATTTATIAEPTDLALTCAKVDITTAGGTDGEASVTATGGTNPYTYSWSNGVSTSTITGLVAGTYTVTITDANGCSSTCSSIVNEPGCNLSAISTGTNVTCNGGTDGSATVTPSGNAGAVTYLWSNGGTTATITALTAGTYTVTVTEAANCTAMASYTVTAPSALALTCAKVDVTTAGGTDGEASVTAAGGTSPYTYSWSNGSATASITGLVAGTYTVTVTDANGCSNTCSSIVNESGGTMCNLSASAAVVTQPTCINNNGVVNLTVTGSIGLPTYLWSNGATTEDLTGLSAGDYTVTVTDGTCTATAMVSLAVVPTNEVYELCPGDSFTLEITNTNLTNIQWQKNGVDIPGANSASYVATEVGIYTYTSNNVGGCSVGQCCPIEIKLSANCCKPKVCTTLKITRH